jgi:Toastrack DUF4097
MTTMTDERDLTRQQFFECDGPVDVYVELGSGSVDVQFADDVSSVRPVESDGAGESDGTGESDGAGDITGTGDTTGTANEASAKAASTASTASTETGASSGPAIVVEVRYQPRTGASWGLAGLLSWMGGQFGAPTPDLAADAVWETTILVHGNRLTVRGPRAMPLRTVPLAIVVHAPAGSSLAAKAGSATVRVGGVAGRVNVSTGSGDVSVDRATGAVHVKAGSGSVRLGPMADGLNARTGSGDLEVTSLDGRGSLASGSGNIWVGTVHGDQVTVRTGSGDLTVAEAAEGLLQLVTGSGDLRVGIRSGVLAEVDVVSGSGRARSDLPLSSQPPDVAGRNGEAVLRVRARTGSGDAVVSAATA